MYGKALLAALISAADSGGAAILVTSDASARIADSVFSQHTSGDAIIFNVDNIFDAAHEGNVDFAVQPYPISSIRRLRYHRWPHQALGIFPVGHQRDCEDLVAQAALTRQARHSLVLPQHLPALQQKPEFLD